MKFNLGDYDIRDLGLGDFSLRDLGLGDFNLGDIAKEILNRYHFDQNHDICFEIDKKTKKGYHMVFQRIAEFFTPNLRNY